MGILKHLLLTGTLLLVAVSSQANQTFSSDRADFRLETVAQNLEHPWSLAFLPDGAMLVTEREGRLRMIRNGSLLEAPISGVPELVVSGQGGLLDIILHPDFKQGRHFAGRMEFDREGNLYVAVGDRGDMDRAQDNADDAGGVHRITTEGSPAPGNPFLDTGGVNDTFYTTGNRNIQGMTIHPETGEIWSHEHGPRGGDEINIIRAGTDYGWPTITYGIDYSGLPITSKTSQEGMAQPLHYWDPSIAPSGMAFYTGNLFPEWQGDLFVGALKMRKLVRLRIQDGKVTEEEDLLTDLGERIRDVRMGPDGALWLLTDSPRGKVYRMVPVQ